MLDISQKLKCREEWKAFSVFLYTMICLFFFFSLAVFQRGFFAYHIWPVGYEVHETIILEEETEGWILPRARGSHKDTEMPIYKAVVECRVQGELCRGTVLRTKEELQGDMIKVAVNKKTQKMYRPELLNYGKGYVRGNIACGVIFLMTLLIDLVIGYQERKNKYVVSITTNEEKWKGR